MKSANLVLKVGYDFCNRPSSQSFLFEAQQPTRLNENATTMNAACLSLCLDIKDQVSIALTYHFVRCGSASSQCLAFQLNTTFYFR